MTTRSQLALLCVHHFLRKYEKRQKLDKYGGGPSVVYEDYNREVLLEKNRGEDCSETDGQSRRRPQGDAAHGVPSHGSQSGAVRNVRAVLRASVTR